jgi:hypothetical protein
MVVMTSSPPSPDRGPSRIAAARARAESAKTALVVSALLAFFGAMLVERGSASSQTSGASTASDLRSIDDSDGFDSGAIAPSLAPPVTSTGTS